MQGSRIQVIIGAALVAAGAGIYGLDHWRAGSRDIQIDHILKNARQITTIDVPPLEDGELVIASDVPMPDKFPTDPDLGFSVEALSFSRSVQIYQWREHQETSTNGDTRYSYSKDWADSPISSSFFHDPRFSNSGSLPFRDRTFRPESYTFGDLKLDKAFASSFPSSKKLAVTREMHDQMPSYFQHRFSIVGGDLFPNRDPRIGDIRVRFSYVPPRQSTVVGAYRDGSIVPATTEAGTIAILREGNLSLEELVAAEKSSNRTTGIILTVIAGIFAVGGVVTAALALRGGAARWATA